MSSKTLTMLRLSLMLRTWFISLIVERTSIKDPLLLVKLQYIRPFWARMMTVKKSKCLSQSSLRMLTLISLTPMDGLLFTTPLTMVILTQSTSLKRQVPTSMLFQTSSRLPSTSLLSWNMLTLLQAFSKAVHPWKHWMSINVHHFILHVKRAVKSALNFSSVKEQISWLLTTDSGLLFIMQATMVTLEQSTSFSNGKQTSTSCRLFKTLKAELPLLSAKTRLSKRHSITFGKPARTETSTWFASWSEKARIHLRRLKTWATHLFMLLQEVATTWLWST